MRTTHNDGDNISVPLSLCSASNHHCHLKYKKKIERASLVSDMIPEWKPSWGYRSKSHTQTQKKERKITVAAAGRNSKFSKWFEIGVVYSGTKEPIEVNDRGGSLLWLLIHRRDRTGGMFARSNFMKLYHHYKNWCGSFCGAVTGQGPVLLSPGIHSFPFKLGLPLGLPSTFLGKHGWVQYYCKAVSVGAVIFYS